MENPTIVAACVWKRRRGENPKEGSFVSEYNLEDEPEVYRGHNKPGGEPEVFLPSSEGKESQVFAHGCNESCGTGSDCCDAPRSVEAVKAEPLSSWDIGEVSVAVRPLFGAAGLIP